MASLSSSSVSGSNSLGNTSLRGFGGLASGIDRDALIEQMTLSTNTKIENQKSNMTKLQWKQEAYRGITDKILDLTDKYASYSSTNNLKDPYLFSKSLITVHGAEAATRFVTATGNSSLVENVAITAVKRLATATVRQSNKHTVDKIQTKALDLMKDGVVKYSKLEGTKLQVGTYDINNKFKQEFSFEFKSSYTKTGADGKTETVKIDYKPQLIQDGGNVRYENDEEFAERLAKELNDMIGATESYKDNIHFKAENGKLLLDGELKNGTGNDTVHNLQINSNSSALSALGYKHSGTSQGVTLEDFNKRVDGTLMDSSVGERSVLDTLAGQKMIFEYDGNQKSVELISKSEVAELKGITDDEERFQKVVDNLQERLNKAFGKGAITVGKEAAEGGDGYSLTFETKGDSSVALLSTDNNLLDALGVEFGESNKVNVDGKLGQAALGLDANAYTKANGQLDLKINGVSIDGLTANSTISDILSKINSTTAAGVKATYVDATGQFMLVSSETGEGREVSLDSVLAEKLFGGYSYNTDPDGKLLDKDGNILAEKDGDGKFIIVAGNSLGAEFTGKEIDENGNVKDGKYFIAADGKTLVNEAGYRVDSEGRLIDKDGFFTDKSGNLVNKDGKLVAIVDKDGKLVDRSKYGIDANGDFVDKATGNKLGDDGTGDYFVKRINADGHFVKEVDGKDKLVDIEGNYVDKEGYIVDEKGNYRVSYDADAKRTDKAGYELDENGNYKGFKVDADGNATTEEALVRNFGGTWYLVNKDGYVLGKKTLDDGTEIDITNIGGTWYKADADGNAIKDADGKYEKVDMPADYDPIKGAVAPKLLEGGAAKNDKQQGVGGTVKTEGTVYDGLYRVDGYKENIEEGQNAKIQVSYGNGVTVDIERSSNTFNLEGLTVTVSGTFGGEYKKDADGKETDEWIADSSETITFTAKADVDKALEAVKAFFEDFNALVTEINGQMTARPDSSYGPLTSAQKAEMDETSIENWEKKAKQGILFGDDVMRDLSGSVEGILASLMSKHGVNYQDLEKIGISYSEDYLDGGTLVFDESKFRSAMESDPDLVSRIISGGDSGGKGLIHAVEDALTPYATRYASKNGNSYGRLIEVAGTEKKPSTLMSNQIYKQLKEMQETIDKLQSQLKVEQDRYISQFSTMESLLNQMNTQSSYLSQLTA